MIKQALVFAVSAACLVSGAASAQSYDRYERSGRVERTDNVQRQDRDTRTALDGRDSRFGDFNGQARRDDRRHDGERNDNRYDHRRDNRYDNRHQQRAYGYGDGNSYRAQMRRGERLSHNQYYVVNDWHRHNRLYAPQRGQQWVQVDGNYALVAIATGIIAQVLLNN